MNETTHRHETRRDGFTLLELLVTIAIIAVLATLLTAGIQRVRMTALVTQTATEIGQMATGIETFKTKYPTLAGKWVPSYIRLREDLAYNPADPIDVASLKWLTLWKPGLDTSTGPINWSGRNAVADWSAKPPKYQYFDLQGDQCLVFFLGGIPVTDPTSKLTAGTGFANNPHNPAYHVNPNGSINGNISTEQGIFEFKSNRLYDRGGLGNYTGSALTAVAANSWRFFSYVDPIGNTTTAPQPYLYYSATQLGNDYNIGNCSGVANVQSLPPSGGFALNNLNPRIIPNSSNPVKFLNPSSFQIISAGVPHAVQIAVGANVYSVTTADYASGPFGPGGGQ